MDGKLITIKFERENRKYEYDEDRMTLTMIDTFLVDKEDVSQIIENINKLDDWEDK